MHFAVCHSLSRVWNSVYAQQKDYVNPVVVRQYI